MLVEDIQDIIEIRLMALGKYKLAKAYITYRYTRELVRRSNTTDLTIKELINGENEYWNSDSTKNVREVAFQRNYLSRNYKYRYYKKIFTSRRYSGST